MKLRGSVLRLRPLSFICPSAFPQLIRARSLSRSCSLAPVATLLSPSPPPPPSAPAPAPPSPPPIFDNDNRKSSADAGVHGGEFDCRGCGGCSGAVVLEVSISVDSPHLMRSRNAMPELIYLCDDVDVDYNVCRCIYVCVQMCVFLFVCVRARVLCRLCCTRDK